MLAALFLLGLLPLAAIPLFDGDGVAGGAADGGADAGSDAPSATDEGPSVLDEVDGPEDGPEDGAETYAFEAEAGDQVLYAFEPGLDRVELDLSSVGGDVYFDTDADETGATLSVGLGGSSVLTLRFPGLAEVPMGDVSMTLTDDTTGEPYHLTLGEAAEQWEGGAVLDPVDPEAPDVPGPATEADVVDPGDPDVADTPGPAGEGTVLEPVDPDLPDQPGEAADWTVADGDAPAEIEGFRVGEDVLRIFAEPGGGADAGPDGTAEAVPEIGVGPSEDGVDGWVRVGGALVAILKGAPDATTADVMAGGTAGG